MEKKNKHKASSTEIERRFEEFSYLWNDCPVVSTPMFGMSTGYVKPEKEKKHSSNLNSLEVNPANKSKLSNSTESTEKPANLPSNNDTSIADLKRKRAVEGHRRQQLDKMNIIKQALSCVTTNDLEFSHFMHEHYTRSKYRYHAMINTEKSNEIEQKITAGNESKVIWQVINDRRLSMKNLKLDNSKTMNKKIVFNENGSSEDKKGINIEKQSKATKKAKLFDEDDDEETKPDLQLKINHQFKGKKGQELLELQSKYASDLRFNADTRFYESSSEDEKEMENTVETDEKEKQRKILESVVKFQITPQSKYKKKSYYRNEETMFLRFDPTNEEHSKYIRKPVENFDDLFKTIKKKKKKKDMVETKEPKKKNITVVSTEKIVTVKDNFKEALKSDGAEDFSLLKLFGSQETLDSEPHSLNNEVDDVDTMKATAGETFTDDFTDLEEEVESLDDNPYKKCFFLRSDDPRFRGVMDWINSVEEETNFGEKRKLLKQIIRHKYKNNQKKKKMFKRKVGRKKTKK